MKREHGFSLLEVLVAVVVLSMGLLGLAGLQVLGLKFNHQSYERTQATLLTYDIIDRMRANPAGANFYATATPTLTNCVSSNCTPEDLAKHDLYEWKKTINASRMLSRGTGTITQSGSITHVEIQWNENGLSMKQSTDVRL